MYFVQLTANKRYASEILDIIKVNYFNPALICLGPLSLKLRDLIQSLSHHKEPCEPEDYGRKLPVDK